MRIRERAIPAFQRALSPAAREEIERLYESAASVLHLGALDLWLCELPAEQIVGQSRAALGCLLATFLAARTGQMWAVTGEHFYLFALGPEFPWLLPTWAVSLERMEMRLDGVLTAADGLVLVRFIEAHLVPSEAQIAAWLRERQAA
jgi:hypothetical protein